MKEMPEPQIVPRRREDCPHCNGTGQRIVPVRPFVWEPDDDAWKLHAGRTDGTYSWEPPADQWFTCKHCGEKAYYEPHDAVNQHARPEKGNGYWCNGVYGSTCAEPDRLTEGAKVAD
jgi:hypothetical protein